MLCAECQVDFPMNQLSSHRDGMVPNLIGMERNRMLCGPCSQQPKPIVIDDVTMKDKYDNVDF
jgi:hypothetical protein